MDSYLDGAIYVTPFYSESRSPGVSEFNNRYMKKYSRVPELLAAQGYDAARIAVEGLGAGERNATAPLALERLSAIDGVTGRLTVGADR